MKKDEKLKINETFTNAFKNHQKNNFVFAEKLYKNILELHPHHFETIFLLGSLYAQINNLEKAKIFLNKAVQIQPSHANAHNNLGNVFLQLEELEEAKKCYEKTIKIESSHISAHDNLGTVFKKLGDHESAINFYKKAIQINPKYANAYNNIGIVYKELEKFEDAIQFYEKAIKINPNYSDAYNNLGNIFKKLKNYNKAINFYQEAIKIKLNHIDANYNLGNIYRDIGDVDKSIKLYELVISNKPDFFDCYNNLLISTCYTTKRKNYLEIANKFNHCITKTLKKNSFNFSKNKNKTLKVGFVSGDFRSHPVGFYLLDLVSNLKNKDLNLYAYYNHHKSDDITKSLKKDFASWTDINKKNDTEVINLIRSHNLDILFDLSGHSSGNRLAIFKNKCAPKQVAWCGWLASTGLKEIDYIIGDPYATPLTDQNKFVEKIYQLKNIWCCLSISNLNTEVRIGKTNNKNLIFGSFNNVSKINSEVIFSWAEILKNISNSKLFLKFHSYDDEYTKLNIVKKFQEHGISDQKLIFEGISPRRELLECYNRVDIALDTFPYNGGTTNFEAAYMGVPILTMKNNSYMFRTGESINKNLNMTDWIAETSDDYIKKAIKFSENRSFLVNLKSNLKNIALKSKLFDAKSFSNDFYNMLQEIVKK